MGFGCKRYWGFLLFVLLWVLLWGSIAVAGSGEHEITVLVNDSAQVSPLVLEQAEVEAGRILHAAGIESAWVNCGRTTLLEDVCHRVPGSNEFVLHIVPTGKTSNDLVFGLTFLAQDGTGRYSDVFFNHLEDAHRKLGTNLSRLLGTVAAHELGHLLLGSHAHSHMGIMRPRWEKETLRQIGMGNLLFTREQACLMKARIERNDVRLVGLGTR